MPAEKVAHACDRLRAPKPKRARAEKEARLSALLERLVDPNGSLQSRARAASTRAAPNALHRNPSAPADNAAGGHQSDSYSRKPQAPMKSPLRQRADADDVPDADSDLMDTETANGAPDSFAAANAPTRKRAHPEAHPLNEVDADGADAAGGASYAKRARVGTPFKWLSMAALANVLTSREQLAHYYATPISDELVTGSHLPESFIFRPTQEVRDARRRVVSSATARRLALNPNSRAEFAAGAGSASPSRATERRAREQPVHKQRTRRLAGRVTQDCRRLPPAEPVSQVAAGAQAGGARSERTRGRDASGRRRAERRRGGQRHRHRTQAVQVTPGVRLRLVEFAHCHSSQFLNYVSYIVLIQYIKCCMCCTIRVSRLSTICNSITFILSCLSKSVTVISLHVASPTLHTLHIHSST